jgi:hypothetical protein
VSDELLKNCNESELIALALRQGLPRLRRGLDRRTLEAIVAGEMDPSAEHLSGTIQTRAKLEAHILKHIEQIRSQLPGCTGMCSTYPCSDGRHALCFAPNETTVRTD